MQLRYIEDYYDKLKERFPDLEYWEIEKILKHGFQSLFTLNNYGADVHIHSGPNSFNMFFGKLFFNEEIRKKYAGIKWKIKHRIKYKQYNPVWDGYYYIGLTQDDYDEYIPKTGGRAKRNKIIEDRLIYKCKEEAMINQSYKYLFAISNEEDGKMVMRKEKLNTRNMRLIAERDNLGKIKYINETRSK